MRVCDAVAWRRDGVRERQRAAEMANGLAHTTVKMTQHCSPGTDEYDELISAAYLGLATAAAKFDPRRKTAFSTYAIAYMRGALNEQRRANDHLTRTQRARVKAGLAVDEGPILSLDNQLAIGDGAFADCLASVVDVEAEAIRAAVRDEVSRAVDALPPREAQSIRLYFVDDLTCREVARVMGCSESRAWQLRSQGLKRLRQRLREDEL